MSDDRWTSVSVDIPRRTDDALTRRIKNQLQRAVASHEPPKSPPRSQAGTVRTMVIVAAGALVAMSAVLVIVVLLNKKM